jgi:hypothetical protein
MRRYLNIVGLLAFVALAVGVPAAAQARVFVGVGIGVPVYRPYYPYYAPYYAPAYYPPPAVVYAPPPVVVAPTPVVAPAPTSNCRQYRGDATVDGANQPFYGTACLQADGRWHIVN